MYREEDFGGGGTPQWPRGYVLFHPEWGIYLGNALGLGFWSHQDPIGQPCAITFTSHDAAREHVRTWPSPLCHETFYLVPVDIDHEGHWASIDSCERAGLPRWNPEGDGKGHPVMRTELPPGLLLN